MGNWYNWLGHLGVALIIGTYLLLQMGRMSSKGILYSALNALGAALIIVSLIYDFNLSALIIEIFWIGISLVEIYRYFRNRTQKAV